MGIPLLLSNTLVNTWRNPPIKAFALAAVILSLALAGCGGGTETYDRDAFTSCFEQRGADITAMSSAIYDDSTPTEVADFLRVVDHVASLPGGAFALSPTGEFLVVYAGSSIDKADKAEGRLRDALGEAGTQFEVRRRSNLLTLTGGHPTRGFMDDVNACADESERT